MISWLLTAVRARLLLPMCADTVDAADRCYVDEVDWSGFVGDNELSITEATTAPLSQNIGGGGELRHFITVELVCADGDLLRARARRDKLTTRLLRPAMIDPTLGGAEDSGTTSGLRQELSKLTWQAQWLDLQGSQGQLAAGVTVSFTLDADWSPATLTP